MPVDLLLKNGKIVTTEGIFERGIAIDEGKIVLIAHYGYLPQADEVIDVRGNYVIPGAVDNHGHPGGKYPLSQDMRTETPGAAAGGVTTWGCSVRVPRMGQELDPERFPGKPEEIPKPEDAISYNDVFELAKRAGEENSLVDFFFDYSLNTMQHALEIPQYAKNHGVFGFKLFGNLKSSAVSPVSPHWHARIGIPVPFDDSLFFKTFQKAAEVGPPARVDVHCENTEVAKMFERELREAGRTDIGAWAERSPGFLEAEHVYRWGFFAKITGGTFYVYHLSSKEGLEACRALKRDPTIKITVETCPQYLTRNINDKPHGNGLLLKVNPPIRTKADNEALWRGIQDGTIDYIGTDHVVTSLHEKLEKGDTSDHKGDPRANVWETGSGFVGVETELPVMLSEGVNAGRISFERLVEVCCRNTAYSSGLYPKKGDIQVGSDADLVIVDMDKVMKVRGDKLFSYADFSIFDGMELKGWPIKTILRGKVIFTWDGEGIEDRQVIGQRGFGKYIPRVWGHQLYPI